MKTRNDYLGISRVTAQCRPIIKNLCLTECKYTKNCTPLPVFYWPNNFCRGCQYRLCLWLFPCLTQSTVQFLWYAAWLHKYTTYSVFPKARQSHKHCRLLLVWHRLPLGSVVRFVAVPFHFQVSRRSEIPQPTYQKRNHTSCGRHLPACQLPSTKSALPVRACGCLLQLLRLGFQKYLGSCQ